MALDAYWRSVHAVTDDDLAAVNYPALPAAFNRLVDRIFVRAFDAAINALAPGCAIEIGCGRGRWLARLRTRGWKTAGFDIAPSARPGAVANAARLPVANASIDLAMAITVLQHIEEKEAAFLEMVRVTKRGGRILLVELIDNPEVAWQAHVMPKRRGWWKAVFHDAGLTVEREEPVEYLPILRMIERMRSGGAAASAAPAPRPSSPAKTAAWNAIALLSRPLEPLARAIDSDAASHRLWVVKKR